MYTRRAVIYKYVRMYVSMYVSMYACMYVSMYVCMYVYIQMSLGQKNAVVNIISLPGMIH